jgi:hypothetical protein
MYPEDIRWVREGYYAPLDPPVLDEPSPLAAETLKGVEPEEYYATVGNDGRGLRVPADLDESIRRYLELSAGDRARFDRATFWLDMASRQWNRTNSASAAFAAYVSAIEALIERPDRYHATRRFKDFLETYAPGPALAARRDQIYELRVRHSSWPRAYRNRLRPCIRVGSALVESTRTAVGPRESNADCSAQMAQEFTSAAAMTVGAR